MRYRDLLRAEGACSIVLGLALAAVAFPGLFVSYENAWIGALFAPATLALLAGFARLRRGIALGRPGAWLTERTLAAAAPGRGAIAAGPLRRRLLIETAIWIVAVGAWVILARQSGLLVFGTGLASVVLGAVQYLGGGHVSRVEEAERREFTVARRPGLGPPELAVEPAPAAR